MFWNVRATRAWRKLLEVDPRTLLSFVPAEGNPLLIQAEPDLRILAFTLSLTVLTGIVFGLAPAVLLESTYALPVAPRAVDSSSSPDSFPSPSSPSFLPSFSSSSSLPASAG